MSHDNLERSCSRQENALHERPKIFKRFSVDGFLDTSQHGWFLAIICTEINDIILQLLCAYCIVVVHAEHACANQVAPSNGELICRHHENGVECEPSCHDGFDFAIVPADKYFCDYDDGVWTPAEHWPVRDCACAFTLMRTYDLV